MLKFQLPYMVVVWDVTYDDHFASNLQDSLSLRLPHR